MNGHCIGFSPLWIDDPDRADPPVQVMSSFRKDTAESVVWRQYFDAKSDRFVRIGELKSGTIGNQVRNGEATFETLRRTSDPAFQPL